MRAGATLLLLAAVVTAGETAFVDVSVVPMDQDHVLAHRTVLVRDGRIVAIGPAGELAVPAGARRIDGKGRYLMPGLADMHVHHWYEEEQLLFLANGVTAVRNLWGRSMHLRWQKEIAAGSRIGPTIYTTGPILDGENPIWQDSVVVAKPEEAEALVAGLKAKGYPALKVYNRLTKPVYEALVKAARKHGLRVTGHVPWGVGIEWALYHRQSCIEHLDGYWHFGQVFDEERFKELARKTVKAGTWNCVTLAVYTKLVPTDEAKKLRARPEMRFVPPRLRATWNPDKDFRTKNMTNAQFAQLRRYNRARLRGTKILHDAGARLLLGTDCGNPFVVAGWSVHEELELLVAAGLTPYQALRTGTRDAAEYLGEAAEFGTVAVGRRADLLLLGKNPLEDVGNAARRVGVMVRGRWLPEEELKRRLEEVAATYAKPAERFLRLPALPEGKVHRFEVRWNGVVVGEQRFAVDGDGTVHAQSVNDAPWSRMETLVLKKNGTGTVTYEDPESTFKAEFDAAVGGEPGVVHGLATFGAWIHVRRRGFGNLKVGAETRFDYGKLDYSKGEPDLKKIPYRVHREPDEDGVLVYTIWQQHPEGIRKSRLTFDADGYPLELVTELQQGTVHIRRK